MNAIMKTNILCALGLDDLPDEKKSDLFMQMTDVILKRVSLRLMRLLPEEDLEEYLRIYDYDKNRGQEFLIKKIPNYFSIVEEEVFQFKQEVLS